MRMGGQSQQTLHNEFLPQSLRSHCSLSQIRMEKNNRIRIRKKMNADPQPWFYIKVSNRIRTKDLKGEVFSGPADQPCTQLLDALVVCYLGPPFPQLLQPFLHLHLKYQPYHATCDSRFLLIQDRQTRTPACSGSLFIFSPWIWIRIHFLFMDMT